MCLSVSACSYNCVQYNTKEEPDRKCLLLPFSSFLFIQTNTVVFLPHTTIPIDTRKKIPPLLSTYARTHPHTNSHTRRCVHKAYSCIIQCTLHSHSRLLGVNSARRRRIGRRRRRVDHARVLDVGQEIEHGALKCPLVAQIPWQGGQQRAPLLVRQVFHLCFLWFCFCFCGDEK